MHSTPSTDLYPLTRNSRFAQISTSPRKRGEVKRAHERVFALAGDARPELMRRSVSLEITRAQGRPGARCTRGLVCKAVQKDAHEHTGSAESIRPSLRDGFTAYSALSPATNSFCHRRRRIEGLVAPGWADIASAGLTPATGARTTRFCRTQPSVFAKRFCRDKPVLT